MERFALISVSQKDGLIEFVRGLRERKFTILCTSGTGKYLAHHDIPFLSVEQYTEQAEIFGGRVKTLHPKIYAGILARRDHAEDLELLRRDKISPIEVVAVNFYPFQQHLDRSNPLAEMVELIDIGGPSMIRAAAKNFSSVYPVIDPQDYGKVLTVMDAASDPASGFEFRRELAAKVFATIASDSADVAAYMAKSTSLARSLSSKPNFREDFDTTGLHRTWSGVMMQGAQAVRYAENPHQRGSFNRVYAGPANTSEEAPWVQLGGKELSYNNFLDCDAAVKLVAMMSETRPLAAILKHLNPCGVAVRDTPLEALRAAKQGDPRSHFGGVIVFNQRVEEDAAREIRNDFAEIVVAPDYSPEALVALSSSKNLRILRVDLARLPLEIELRTALDGVLIQETDRKVSLPSTWSSATSRAPTKAELDDLHMAWRICSQVKSNAIVLVKDLMLLASGAGQMSRIDSVEVALHKCKVHSHDLAGAVAASDAFFPFPDSVETLGQAGVVAIVAPSGAKKDEEVKATAERCGVSLLFTTDRHFKH